MVQVTLQDLYGMFVGKNHLGLVIEVGDIWQLLMTELLKDGARTRIK